MKFPTFVLMVLFCQPVGANAWNPFSSPSHFTMAPGWVTKSTEDPFTKMCPSICPISSPFLFLLPGSVCHSQLLGSNHLLLLCLRYHRQLLLGLWYHLPLKEYTAKREDQTHPQTPRDHNPKLKMLCHYINTYYVPDMCHEFFWNSCCNSCCKLIFPLLWSTRYIRIRRRLE